MVCLLVESVAGSLKFQSTWRTWVNLRIPHDLFFDIVKNGFSSSGSIYDEASSIIMIDGSRAIIIRIILIDFEFNLIIRRIVLISVLVNFFYLFTSQTTHICFLNLLIIYIIIIFLFILLCRRFELINRVMFFLIFRFNRFILWLLYFGFFRFWSAFIFWFHLPLVHGPKRLFPIWHI